MDRVTYQIYCTFMDGILNLKLEYWMDIIHNEVLIAGGDVEIEVDLDRSSLNIEEIWLVQGIDKVTLLHSENELCQQIGTALRAKYLGDEDFINHARDAFNVTFGLTD